MQRQRGELVPVAEVLADLPGPVKALREAPPPCIAQLAKRDRVLSALFAWTVVSEPPCPVLRACNRSAASVPRTSPTTM